MHGSCRKDFKMQTGIHDEIVYIDKKVDDYVVELAMQYTDGYSENIYSFANNINTHEGGTHLAGFKTALTKTINEYAKRNKLLKEKLMFKGTVNASLISPREIFMEALTCHAVRLVLVHNHPSGDPAPSPEDVRMTHRIYKTGEMLGIQLLDHIIIGDHCYSSFQERGILSEE